MSNTSLQGLLITILILVMFVIVIGSLGFVMSYGNRSGTTGLLVLLGCFIKGGIFMKLNFESLAIGLAFFLALINLIYAFHVGNRVNSSYKDVELSEINLPTGPSKKEFKPISDYLSSKGMSDQAINGLRDNMNVDNKSFEEN